MKKIGNWPITEANTDFSKISTKSEQNFDEFWSFEFYERSLWHCRFDRTLSYSAKVCARLKFQNLSKFCSDLRKIGICFGNRPIADFFHDQTIFLKDYELYIIGHSLALINIILRICVKISSFIYLVSLYF